MRPLTADPDNTVQDYSMIPRHVLDALADVIREMKFNEDNATIEIAVSAGGVARVSSVIKRVYTLPGKGVKHGA